eukprot:358784-Chlamydomonas_euryale.AAC.8
MQSLALPLEVCVVVDTLLRGLYACPSGCHNGAGRNCKIVYRPATIVTRRETDDILRSREDGPASRRYSV